MKYYLGSMKKILLALIFVGLPFLFINAQDTLIFKTGEKDIVKVDSLIGPFVVYKIPPNRKQLSINLEKLNYIKYGNGKVYSNPFIKKTVSLKDTSSNMPININAGAGISLISLEIPGRGYGGGPEITSRSPAYNCTADYRFIRQLSIGIGWSYQSLTDYPATASYTIKATQENEQISRYQFSGIIAVHFSKDAMKDIYAGYRMGESVWTERVSMISNVPLSDWRTFNGNATSINYQVFFGYRYFPIYNFGLHFEVGIGSPFLLECGLTYRFKTRKNKKLHQLSSSTKP